MFLEFCYKQVVPAWCSGLASMAMKNTELLWFHIPQTFVRKDYSIILLLIPSEVAVEIKHPFILLIAISGSFKFKYRVNVSRILSSL